mmetsp:Transcript_47680/g.61191  ORF Transcript_47680/g.61191 Transcript_47680/m.61191 type:complete len:589 (-) Transcript_47680:146-1912(-)
MKNRSCVPFGTLYPKAGGLEVSLLEGLLQFEPDLRADAKHAMHHAYFAPFEPGKEPEPAMHPDFNFNFERQNLQRPRLKQLILDEVASFRREVRNEPEPVAPQVNVAPTTLKQGPPPSSQSTSTSASNTKGPTEHRQQANPRPTQDNKPGVPQKPPAPSASFTATGNSMKTTTQGQQSKIPTYLQRGKTSSSQHTKTGSTSSTVNKSKVTNRALQNQRIVEPPGRNRSGTAAAAAAWRSKTPSPHSREDSGLPFPPAPGGGPSAEEVVREAKQSSDEASAYEEQWKRKDLERMKAEEEVKKREALQRQVQEEEAARLEAAHREALAIKEAEEAERIRRREEVEKVALLERTRRRQEAEARELLARKREEEEAEAEAQAAARIEEAARMERLRMQRIAEKEAESKYQAACEEKLQEGKDDDGEDDRMARNPLRNTSKMDRGGLYGTKKYSEEKQSESSSNRGYTTREKTTSASGYSASTGLYGTRGTQASHQQHRNTTAASGRGGGGGVNNPANNKPTEAPEKKSGKGKKLTVPKSPNFSTMSWQRDRDRPVQRDYSSRPAQKSTLRQPTATSTARQQPPRYQKATARF